MMSDVKKEIKSFLELTEKERLIKPYGTHENGHTGKLIALRAYIKNWSDVILVT